MIKIVVSATTMDGSPEPVEIPWTRQIVATESDAKRLVDARNRAEQACHGDNVWSYYEVTTDD